MRPAANSTASSVINAEPASYPQIFQTRRKIRRRHNDDISGHFGMYIAQERSRAEVMELERFLLTLRPSPEIVRKLFVSADRRPIDVMADRVAVQEVDRGPLLYGNDMRKERHFPLVDHDVVFRRIELLVRNYIHIDGDVFCGLNSLHTDLAFDFIGPTRPCQGQRDTCYDYCLCCDSRYAHDIPLVFDLHAIQFPSQFF